MWITTAAYQPFEAEMMVSKKAMNLGFFSTAEETALSCARRRAAEPAAAQCRLPARLSRRSALTVRSHRDRWCVETK